MLSCFPSVPDSSPLDVFMVSLIMNSWCRNWMGNETQHMSAWQIQMCQACPGQKVAVEPIVLKHSQFKFGSTLHFCEQDKFYKCNSFTLYRMWIPEDTIKEHTAETNEQSGMLEFACWGITTSCWVQTRSKHDGHSRYHYQLFILYTDQSYIKANKSISVLWVCHVANM